MALLGSRHTVESETRQKQLVGIVVVLQDDIESEILDQLGSTVGEDGLIAKGEYEVRLSDGYAEHYVHLKTPKEDA